MEISNRTYLTCECERFKASLVKYSDPGCIVLQLHLDDYDEDIQKSLHLLDVLNQYFERHEGDPIEGRKFRRGEIVAVKWNDIWQPAMIVCFKMVNAAHYYDVLFLEYGFLAEVHRMSFREIPAVPIFNAIRNLYAFFTLANILPVHSIERNGSYISWGQEVYDYLNHLLRACQTIDIVLTARQIIGQPYFIQLLHGNMFIKIGSEIVNVKEKLLSTNLVAQDAASYTRYSEMSPADFIFEVCDACRNECEEMQLEATRLRSEFPYAFSNYDCVYSSFKYPDDSEELTPDEEITDENLDKYLHKAWRRDGYDPFNQMTRDKIRHLMRGDQKISFHIPKSQRRRPRFTGIIVDSPERKHYSLVSFQRPEQSVAQDVERCQQKSMLSGRNDNAKGLPHSPLEETTGKSIENSQSTKSPVVLKPEPSVAQDEERCQQKSMLSGRNDNTKGLPHSPLKGTSHDSIENFQIINSLFVMRPGYSVVQDEETQKSLQSGWNDNNKDLPHSPLQGTSDSSIENFQLINSPVAMITEHPVDQRRDRFVQGSMLSGRNDNTKGLPHSPLEESSFESSEESSSDESISPVARIPIHSVAKRRARWLHLSILSGRHDNTIGLPHSSLEETSSGNSIENFQSIKSPVVMRPGHSVVQDEETQKSLQSGWNDNNKGLPHSPLQGTSDSSIENFQLIKSPVVMKPKRSVVQDEDRYPQKNKLSGRSDTIGLPHSSLEERSVKSIENSQSVISPVVMKPKCSVVQNEDGCPQKRKLSGRNDNTKGLPHSSQEVTFDDGIENSQSIKSPVMKERSDRNVDTSQTTGFDEFGWNDNLRALRDLCEAKEHHFTVHQEAGSNWEETAENLGYDKEIIKKIISSPLFRAHVLQTEHNYFKPPTQNRVPHTAPKGSPKDTDKESPKVSPRVSKLEEFKRKVASEDWIVKKKDSQPLPSHPVKDNEKDSQPLPSHPVKDNEVLIPPNSRIARMKAMLEKLQVEEAAKDAVTEVTET